jgi:hypothetical protein
MKDIKKARIIRDSSVSILTNIQAGRPRNRDSIPGKGKIFLLRNSVQIYSGDHPVSCPAHITESKRPKREAALSSPSNVEDKEARSYTSTFLS